MCLLKKCTLLSIVCVLCFSYNSNAQLLKKLKDKVNNAVNGNNSNTTQTTQTANSSSNSSGSPTNTKGGGLTNTTPPDVNQQMTDAEKSQAAGN